MTDDLEVQVRELVQDADWRSNMYPERLISALAAWARRLVTENARDAVSATVDQFAAALNAIAPRPNQWRQMWPPEDVLRRLVADSRAGALDEARIAMCEAADFGSAYEAVCALVAPRCRPANHPDDCEPGAQDRDGQRPEVAAHDAEVGR